MKLIEDEDWNSYCVERTKELVPLHLYDDGVRRGMAIATKWLDAQPTLTPESLVKRGRWILADDGNLRCSNCTQKAPAVWQWDDEPITTATFYCPHCGAKMVED